MYNPVIDLLRFFDWLYSKPWRVLLVLLAWFALGALVAAVRHFIKWLFN
jgi:uncharacterized protein involved in exopolysaccharide biosynthesis